MIMKKTKTMIQLQTTMIQEIQHWKTRKYPSADNISSLLNMEAQTSQRKLQICFRKFNDFEKYQKEWKKVKVALSEMKRGFPPNRSTIDPIFIVQQRLEKSIGFNSPLFMCFIDFKRAFDRVKLDNVLTELRRNG